VNEKSRIEKKNRAIQKIRFFRPIFPEKILIIIVIFFVRFNKIQI